MPVQMNSRNDRTGNHNRPLGSRQRPEQTPKADFQDLMAEAVQLQGE